MHRPFLAIIKKPPEECPAVFIGFLVRLYVYKNPHETHGYKGLTVICWHDMYTKSYPYTGLRLQQEQALIYS
ncbi:MAG: hypothetical protein COB36_03635 [Alphaproteobacteria bacterium]|nr:MAG: hypothetical protein COB36_03635 [Alphaproteobacteria bacterium]